VAGIIQFNRKNRLKSVGVANKEIYVLSVDPIVMALLILLVCNEQEFLQSYLWENK